MPWLLTLAALFISTCALFACGLMWARYRSLRQFALLQRLGSLEERQEAILEGLKSMRVQIRMQELRTVKANRNRPDIDEPSGEVDDQATPSADDKAAIRAELNRLTAKR